MSEEAVLAEAIIGASRAVRDGHPQTALDVIDAVLLTLPETGAEAIELAALPTKIMALAHLGRSSEALAQLDQLDQLAAAHGTDDDRAACTLLRDRLHGGGIDLQTRMQAAMAAIQGGNAEAMIDLEQLVEEAAAVEQHLVVGGLIFLGKVCVVAERPDLARPRLQRAKEVLPLAQLEGERLATAAAEIDKLLAALPA